ncbi:MULTISPECIES: VOC family protein [Micromonospora]|uniref:VOC family protein n=1 Tax=Verrucosispora sioxanthis TaxID=2499994 RepID=A0A6M1KY24_9ACTN|nr:MULTISPECIES: VOC family protein [Micromonospora]MCZ7422940.1 VOC family protein [Verrucosispora sp. WMMA2121]NEE63819.1 VOC family protein [Verrucosispora sioxanthis]NGM12929.1 VOC family protein [Verrucosispora sioxanthis]WBB50881.1 VOC family protein [Verrucosispora sp. WMMA2044]WBB90669.1 VOC family protein [Verrucosispora sp. WMMC514]
MITNVSLTSVFVKDIDAAKTFYVDILGFVEGVDITLGEGYRWCTVKHPSQPELEVHLTLPGPPLTPEVAEMFRRAQDEGNLFAVGLAVDDCRKTYDDLRAKGVDFIQEPADRPYGVEAVARDNSGNWLVLVEQREFTPADFD